MNTAAASIVSLLLASIGATLATAQNPIPFQHIIIVFQENRTPDNLFGSGPVEHLGCGTADPFEAGVDIDNGGLNNKAGQPNPTCSVVTPLKSSCDPGHGHQSFLSMYDGGPMDGACSIPTKGCDPALACPQFAYVQKADVQPYFDIATNYGFANYMFQTNEGPSFPAHQFILSGTSAPVPYNDPSKKWTWFAAENPGGFKSADNNTGCAAPANEFVRLIDPAHNESTCSMIGGPYCVAPCYEHAPGPTYTYGTMPDLLNSQNPPISWKYYTPLVQNGIFQSGLWVAPAAIKHLCGENGNSGQCDAMLQGGTYANNIRQETAGKPYPLMDDINACQLAAVSWAIPDKLWSDHGSESNRTGPSYVANIVNAIGENTNCKDPVNSTLYSYWQDTAIFITWDDWGGWFDHVPPFQIKGPNCGEWGCNYVYGFRVPLLVVSAYTKPGYVSGALPSPGEDAAHTHDFGSILAFIENNFLGRSAIGTIGPIQYPFADAFAPELAAGVVPLADFFQFPYRGFTPIPVPAGYDASYFQNYFVNNPDQAPDGPDANDD
jgi:phospholipase C